MLETLQISDFAEHLHQSYTVMLASGDTLELQLAEISALGTPADDRRRSFSLIFRHARTDAYLPQGIHTLHHPEMGPFELFLVPLGPASDGMRDEVVFA